MPVAIVCPECRSANVSIAERLAKYHCIDCGAAFVPPTTAKQRRVFLSYAHDAYSPFAEMLTAQLRIRTHEVWLDANQLKAGADWERDIEAGLDWAAEPGKNGCIVLLMTPHAVRRPDGYCLNELAQAIARKPPIIPVMLSTCEPPLSIARLRWLEMRGCAEDPPTRPFQPQFACLVDALEHDNLDFQGGQSHLLRYLSPPDFSADIQDRLRNFVGREWVFERMLAWLHEPNASRVFWITGGPGVGKSALAAEIAKRFPDAAAFHACVHGHTEKADPRRVAMSIAYQLAMALPSYFERLSVLDLDRICSEANAGSLFDSLVVQPLASGVADPGRTVVVVLDALDEATHDGRNELASFISQDFPRTPRWLRLIMTSRAENEVTLPLQGLDPYVLDAESAENRDDLRSYFRRQLPPLAPSGIREQMIDDILDLSAG